MRVGLGFGFGPLRFYIPLASTRRRRRRHRVRYWTHPGCPVRHQREDTANSCARRMK
jgi:hypothetical protein